MSQRQRSQQNRRNLGLVAGAVFAGLALAVRTAPAGGSSAPEIHIQNFRFDPPTLGVAVGTTVTWVNHDEEIHTVTSSQAPFTSPGLDSDQQFSHRFDRPGTYEYRCTLHPQMKGTIVVH